MNPHLLFLSERYPPDLGGVAASGGRISRALATNGADVDVITWTRTLAPGVVAHEEGNPSVYRMGRFREWDVTLPHTSNLFDWLMSVRPYDAIWGHYLAPAGFLAAWLGERKSVPAVVSVRGNDIDRDMFPPGDFARLLWTLQHASCVTAVTGELTGKVRALSGRKDVVHLPNAVDPEIFRPGSPDRMLRETLGIRPEETVLGFAGELREKKGQQFLLQALRAVRENRPACLLVIGEARPSEVPRLLQQLNAEMDSAADDPLIRSRVLITGQLATPEEVNRHLQLCDVYLQPSLWDGMPNALLEAMAAGCLCIASDAGGIPEMIQPGVSGEILPRWQLHRLGEAALQKLDAPEADRLRIRQAARERASSRFSFRQERERLQVLLARLIPNSS